MNTHIDWFCYFCKPKQAFATQVLLNQHVMEKHPDTRYAKTIKDAEEENDK